MASSLPIRTVFQLPQSMESTEYRRSERVDGNVVRVVEARRQPPKYRTWQCSPSPSVSFSTEYATQYRMDRNRLARPKASETADLREAAKGAHVTPTAKRSRRTRAHRTKPVIVQNTANSAQQGNSSSNATKEPLEAGRPSSPPPTPRFQRLPTPDLPDLLGDAFCDCCLNNKLLRFCASCGCPLEK